MRNKMMKTLAAVTLAVALPIGLATQADARPVTARPVPSRHVANTGFGCVVTPLAPQRVFFHTIRKTVNYPTYAWCQGGRRVSVQDVQYVRHNFTDYPSGFDVWSRTFPTWPHVINKAHRLPFFTQYPIGTYHKVRFQVSNGSFTSPWSFWETSPTTWVWN